METNANTVVEPLNSGFYEEIEHFEFQKLIGYSSEAICALWDNKHGTFFRSTEHKERGEVGFFPTVTFSSARALVALANCPYYPQFKEELTTFLNKSVLPKLVAFRVEGASSSLNKADGNKELNIFTLVQVIQALSGTMSSRSRVTTPQGAKTKLKEFLKDAIDHSYWEHYEDAHPFITYHVIKALFAKDDVKLSLEVRRKIVDYIEKSFDNALHELKKLLAVYQLGTMTPGEAVALAFSAASLALSNNGDYLQHVLVALDICFEHQDQNGCWPLGRVVRSNKDISADHLEISTYEIASVVTETVLLIAQKRDALYKSSDFLKILRGLHSAATYSELSVVRRRGADRPYIGWCSDHPYGEKIIESWTSAALLQFIISYQGLTEEFLRVQILSTLTTSYPEAKDWPSWLKWDSYKETSEVDHKFKTLDYINNKMLEPIVSNNGKLPLTEGRSVSALLFGPPGTSKTTIVKAAAERLSWPVVFLSPGDFIERGLEYIESQTKQVFEKIMKLSKAVVIFDECDELFRNRAPIETTEQTRGITAFVTASMLPKLQELHDRGKVLFFICTNHFDSMDPAIKRGGRIDHIIGIGPPDETARKLILGQAFADAKVSKSYYGPVLPKLATKTQRFIRSELVRLAKHLASNVDLLKSDGELNEVITNFKKSLTISDEEYRKFESRKKDWSRPIVEGR